MNYAIKLEEPILEEPFLIISCYSSDLKNKDLDINNESSGKQSDTYIEVILSSGKKLSYTSSEQKKLIKDLENIKL